MKKFIWVLAVLMMCTFNGCTKKKYNNATYIGTIVEQNSLSPLPNLHVSITDGINKYSETVTNSMGQFSIDLTNKGSMGLIYIFIDGNGVYPSKKIDLIYTEEEQYDYGLIFLFNQTDASLHPKIENVAWDYPNGNNTMRFKDIVIKSDYTLTEAYVEFSKNEGFTLSDKYQLEKMENGMFFVNVDNLTVGETYYFQIVASNTIGTGRSEVFSRKYGFPFPSIIELKYATVSSATIKMSVIEDPLSTSSAGLCWSTSHNPTVGDNTQLGGTVGTSEVTISGLNFRTTTYYVRAYAENANGIGYSNELVLPANNPYSLPTFTSGGYTYSYIYLGYGSWYTANNACTSLVYVFDDWTLPPVNVLPDFFNTYYAENGETLLLPLWSRLTNQDLYDDDPGASMLTTNGCIWAPKDQFAHYYAVRKF